MHAGVVLCACSGRWVHGKTVLRVSLGGYGSFRGTRGRVDGCLCVRVTGMPSFDGDKVDR